MSLFRDPEEHAANPPSSWKVVRVARGNWDLRTVGDVTLDHFKTERAAVAAKRDSWLARLWAQEGAWYEGETPSGYRPWADVKAERDRRQHHSRKEVR